MAEILTIGEPLVLFASKDLNMSLTDAKNFNKFLAGAEINFAVGATRLGHDVAYISQVGNDSMGNFIIKELKKYHISTSHISINPLFPTGIEFKSRTNIGDPETFYLRKNSAAANMDDGILNKIFFSHYEIAHLTGIFPALSTNTFMLSKHLIKLLHQHKIPLCFDPNLRPALWKNKTEMIKITNYFAYQATIFLPGLKEARQLTNIYSPFKIAEYYFSKSKYLKLIVIKDGSHGTYFFTKTNNSGFISSFPVKKVIDTVGAGDGFALGLITSLLENNTNLKEAIIRANAIGALAIQSPGDNDGYPTPEELKMFINSMKEVNYEKS